MAQDQRPRFRTQQGAAAYLAAYDAVVDRWPITPEQLRVRTRFGTTALLAVGPALGSPVVLVHGGGSTAAVWFANSASLARDHRV